MTFDSRPVRHAYEQIAHEYAEKFDDELTTNEFDRAVLDAAVGDLDPGARIVDLGCGPGQVGAYLATRGRSAVGLDLTEAMLAIAHQRHPTLRGVCGDLLALPFRGAGIDGVVAWYSLHNFPRAVLPRALSELHSALRPGGVVLIGTHAGVGEEVVEHQWKGVTESVTITYYEPAELASALTARGFHVREVRQRAPLDHEHQVTKIYALATRS